MNDDPDEGHPTLAQYIRWARGQGCQTGTLTVNDEELCYLSRGGQQVVFYESQKHIALRRSLIAYYDRRLKLISPWSVPSPNGH